MTQFKKLPQELSLGRFRLIAQLGRGGMAEVFLARLIGAGGFEKLVAIKRMLPEVSRNPTFVAMFLREGRIAAQLDHPNICHVYELGEDSGTLYLAMELLRGLPWSDVMPAIPDRPHIAAVRFIIGFAIQACDGLHHAHTAVGADLQTHPIVHRDVSPANLFVTNEGMVKLLDFGVSKVMTDATLTSNGVPRGTLPYMAPEQLHGQGIDARADVFSLAVVLWEALAGRPLFGRASAYDTVMAVAEANVPPLPGDGIVIARLDSVLRRALAADRAKRPSSARELAQELRWAIAGYGEPMITSEIEAHLAQWVGPSLIRRGKNLAEILGRGVARAATGDDEQSGEHTSLHAAKPATGARLRDVAIVVDANRIVPITHDTVIAPPPTEDMLSSSQPHPAVVIPPSGATVIDALPMTRPVPMLSSERRLDALPPTRPMPMQRPEMPIAVSAADEQTQLHAESRAATALSGEQTQLHGHTPALIPISGEQTLLHGSTPALIPISGEQTQLRLDAPAPVSRTTNRGYAARPGHATPAPRLVAPPVHVTEPGQITQRGHVAQPGSVAQPGPASPLGSGVLPGPASPRGSVPQLGRGAPNPRDGREGPAARIPPTGAPLGRAVPIVPILVIAAIVVVVVAVMLLV